MANHTTGAQRRNARMDKIFEKAKSEERGLVGNSGLKGYGVNSPAMAKHKALEKKMSVKHEGGERKLQRFDIYRVGKGGKETHEKSRFL